MPSGSSEHREAPSNASHPIQHSALRAPPSTVPDHELLRRIGGGSYGEVWLARNVVGTFRAVKIVHRRTFENERPYEREYAGIQKFEPVSRSHEGFVDILQIGRNDAAGCFYYVMELADDAAGVSGKVSEPVSEKVGSHSAGNSLTQSPDHDGGAVSGKVGECVSEKAQPASFHSLNPATYVPKTLARLMRPPTHSLTGSPTHSPTGSPTHPARLPIEQCITIGRALARALAHLHAQGLVHRDIKPSNIIFVGGVPKLADIGLVTDAGEARSFVGTEGFIPPEGPGTPAADLFSLGKVLYEASTGKDRQDFPEPLTNLGDQPDKDRLLELNAILHRACQSDPCARYRSAEEMLAELELLQRGESVRTKRSRQRRLAGVKKLSLTVAALALLATGVWFLFNRFNGSTVQRINGVPEVNSIAVLPFVNQDSSEAHEYLAAILSDETRNALTNCMGLRVAPSPVAFAFKHATNNFREIGKQLGVRAILTGSMNRTSNQLRVAARLMNVADGAELWSATFDQYRRSTNLPEIASQVVSNVAQVLKLSLPRAATRQVETNFAHKLAAYRFYSQALSNAWNTQEGMNRAVELLNQAIAEDPGSAQAYATLAFCYANASGWLMHPSQGMSAAKANAQRALQLDNSIAKAHLSLAVVMAYHELEPAKAEREFQQAIELAPRDGNAYAYYAYFLSSFGKFARAEKVLGEGEQVDPRSHNLLASWCWHYYKERQYDQMLDRADRLRTFHPDSVVGLMLQAKAHERLGNYKKALAIAQQMVQRDPSPDYVAFLGMVHGRLGHTDEAQAILEKLSGFSDIRRGLLSWEAQVLLGLRQTDASIAKLRMAVEDYPPGVLDLSWDPLWDDLRSDSRFTTLLKKIEIRK